MNLNILYLFNYLCIFLYIILLLIILLFNWYFFAFLIIFGLLILTLSFQCLQFIIYYKSIFWSSRKLLKSIKNWSLKKMGKGSWSSKKCTIFILLIIFLIFIFNWLHHKTINSFHLKIKWSFGTHWVIFVKIRCILVI